MTKRVAGAGHWTRTMRARFLDHLSATCDVDACAAMVGVTPEAVHALRREDGTFAAAWAEALQLGYVMLETLTVARALSGGAGVGTIDVALAVKVLALRRDAGGAKRAGAAAGPAGGSGAAAEIATPESTGRVLLRKLAEIEARRGAAA